VADGVTAQDATGRLIYANEAAARLVGYASAREFTEAPVGEVLAGFEVFDEEGRPFPLGTCRVGGPSPARRGPRRCCASASWPRARSVGR
jgi:PAS domain-containing protein